MEIIFFFLFQSSIVLVIKQLKLYNARPYSYTNKECKIALSVLLFWKIIEVTEIYIDFEIYLSDLSSYESLK